MVDGTQELPNIMNLSKEIQTLGNSKDAYPSFLKKLSELQITELGNKYIDQTRWGRGDAPLFIDKMPNNFRHIPLIQLILPKAKIIDARRHPMACCFSGFKQLFAEGQEFTYGLDDLASYYNDYVELMDHWNSVLPGSILSIRYEDVVADIENSVKKILEYCDLPFEQSCVEFYKTKRSVKTPSAEQVRQPIYTTGLDYWKNFDSYLIDLKENLKY